MTLIQADLAWEDIDANINRFDKKINSIREETDLVVLPEMFSTGFSMNAEALAQEMDGSAVQWLRSKSEKINIDIVGSLMIREEGGYYNRLIWAKPDGAMFIYDKRHLFRFAGEEKVYRGGKKNITVELKGWKIRPFICYDLRFPVWTRNLNNQYDIALFIANWPAKRSLPWKTLLMARAIENQCYVVGVNRVGTDGKGFPYKGDSAIIDPKGKRLFSKSGEESIFSGELSRKTLKKTRELFPAWVDADIKMVTSPD